MDQLNVITQQNAGSTEELAATAEEMSGQAEQLQQMMSFFKVDDGAPAVMHGAGHVSAAKPVIKKPARSTPKFVAALHEKAEFVKF